MIQIKCFQCGLQMRRLDIRRSNTGKHKALGKPDERGEFWCPCCKYRVWVTNVNSRYVIKPITGTALQQRRKLTDAQIVYIRDVISRGVNSTRNLARHFGVGQATIQHIVKGETYKHIREEERHDNLVYE